MSATIRYLFAEYRMRFFVASVFELIFAATGKLLKCILPEGIKSGFFRVQRILLSKEVAGRLRLWDQKRFDISAFTRQTTEFTQPHTCVPILLDSLAMSRHTL